jgi:hypothetical protein
MVGSSTTKQIKVSRDAAWLSGCQVILHEFSHGCYGMVPMMAIVADFDFAGKWPNRYSGFTHE